MNRMEAAKKKKKGKIYISMHTGTPYMAIWTRMVPFFLFCCSLHPNIDLYSVPEKDCCCLQTATLQFFFFTASCNSIGSYGRLLDSQQNLFVL